MASAVPTIEEVIRIIRTNADMHEVRPEDLMLYINRVHRDLCENYPLTRQTFSINTTLNSKSYSLHASITAVQRVRYVYGTGEFEFDELSPKHLEDIINSDPSILQSETPSQPTEYYVEGLTLNVIDPAPITSATVDGEQIPRLEVDAYAYSELSLSSSVPDLIPNGEIYAYGAMRRYLEDSLSTTADKGQYQARLTSIQHFRNLEREALAALSRSFVGKADRFAPSYKPKGDRFARVI